MKKEVKLEELGDFVKNFLDNIPTSNVGTVVGLYGNLGAGKTTFVKEVAKQLGVKEEVTSPTFTLMQRFKIRDSRFENLVHIDLYRIEDIEEVKILKLEELFADKKNLVLIEWAEKLEESRFKNLDLRRIEFDYKDEESRLIEIQNG